MTGGYDVDAVVESLEDFGYTCCSTPLFSEKILSLANLFSLSEDDLGNAIIAFANNQKKNNIDLVLLDLLEPELAKQLKASEAKTATTPSRRAKTTAITPSRRANLDISIADSEISFCEDGSSAPLPGKYANFAPVSNALGNSKYQHRQDSGKVSVSLKGSLFTSGGKAAGRADVEIVSSSPDAFYAKDKAVNVIDEKCERMLSFADLYAEENKEVALWTREIQASQEEIFVFGEVIRETNDVMQDGFAHLLLDDENGSILPVNISGLSSVRLFPGQIVAFRGVNETGSYLDAKKQLSPPLLPATPIQKTELDNLTVWAASGPFTSSNSLAFESLCDLLDQVRKEGPHVLVLMGPFVDRKHRCFSEPGLDLGMKDVMDSLMIKIAERLESCRTELILQASSSRDASSYGYFPSPPFTLPNEAKKILGKRVHVVSDPAMVKVAGVSVAITSSEVVAHLSRAEWYKAGDQENSDRIARLAGHLLEQRSLYPLSPAGLPTCLSDSFNLCELTSAPHIVFIPSMLPASVKMSAGTVLCNPGSLIRGATGTFFQADINISVISDPSHFVDASHFQIVKI